MNLKKFRPPSDVTITVEAGKSHSEPIVGRFFVIADANASGFKVALDLGDPFTCEIARGYRLPDDEEDFQQLRVINETGAKLVLRVFYGRGAPIDNALNVIPGSEGSPASFVATFWERYSVTIAAPDTWELLAPADPNRETIRLFSAGAAIFWAPENTWPAENENDIAQTSKIEGYLELRTRSAIYVRAAAAGLTVKGYASQY